MNDHVRMPVLPVEAYTSQSWFDREQELIFSRTWQYSGLAEDISEPGQYISVQAGLNNIFIVMGRDRRLRAFHNICRHRGTQLLRAVGKTQKAITCPYHDWTYDLEGNLISVPDREREFPDLDLSCKGLLKASVDLWRGILWVHPDPDAGSIAEWFGDFENRLAPYSPDELVEWKEGATEHDIAANWKIVVENYIDAYHLAHLHSGTLAMYDHSRITSGFVGPHFAFYEPLAPEYRDNIGQRRRRPSSTRVRRKSSAPMCPCCSPIWVSGRPRARGRYFMRFRSVPSGRWSGPAQRWRTHRPGNTPNRA